MFEQTLTEGERRPVLGGIHWLIAIVLGVAGYFLWYYFLSLIIGQPPTHGALVFQSIVFGFGFPFVETIILCYVYVDSKRWNFSTTLWLIITIILSLLGFLIYLFWSIRRTKQYTRGSMPFAFLLEGIIVGIAILIPLIKTQALPTASLVSFLAAPPPPPPPAPPPPAAPKIVVHQVSLSQLLKAPTVIPKKIVRIKDSARPNYVGVSGGVPGGVPGGSASGVMGSMLSNLAPPPPPPPKAVVPKVIRVGGDVEAAKAIYHPDPQYPPIAKMARIQGTVVLQALIAKDGTIEDLHVVSGSPMLANAAMEAVRQWRYEPTLLNGIPVEVATEIDVQFTLSE